MWFAAHQFQQVQFEAFSACLKQRNCWPNGQMRAKWLRQWLETEILNVQFKDMTNTGMFFLNHLKKKHVFWIFIIMICLDDRGSHCKRSLLPSVQGSIIVALRSYRYSLTFDCFGNVQQLPTFFTLRRRLWHHSPMAARSGFSLHQRCRILDGSWMKSLVW